MNTDSSVEEVDERPQRCREYSGATSTLGVSVLVILTVSLALWWFQFRGLEGEFPNSSYGVITIPAEQNPTGDPPSPEVGRAAPNFLLPAIGGGDEQLSMYRGRWVLLNFWASWCGPCRQEASELQRLQERRPSVLAVLGVNQQETPDTAAELVDDYGLTYPTALDLFGEVSMAYGVGRQLPVSILVDRDGVIRKVHRGRLDEATIRTLEAEYLD